MFVKVRRTFTVGAVLFLLFLFTVPSLYLQEQCAAMEALCDRVLAFAEAGDDAQAQDAYVQLKERYEDMRGRAELFLDHRVIDDAGEPLFRMEAYLSAGDAVSLAAEAAGFRMALQCMLSVETGDLRLLL